MKLTQHSKYLILQQSREIDQRCQEAMAAWKASGEPISVEEYSLRWTLEQTQVFVRELSHLIQEYNRVLWEQFPYCRQCSGHCCRAELSPILDEFDSIALTLLGRSFPELPKEIEATDRDCIYRTARGCAWPAEWRPTRCWSFFCLGQSEHQKDEQQKQSDLARKRYDEIVDQLTWVVLDFMPEPLRMCGDVWQDPLENYISEPADFCEVLDEMVFAIWFHPFNERYPMIEE
ncbi:MAG: hypothetical protein GY832_12500 [Chloroflexi bacterium]|nr:hypothetical protein [Chloroflexota bacterium]